jgi:hypothetical protein
MLMMIGLGRSIYMFDGSYFEFVVLLTNFMERHVSESRMRRSARNCEATNLSVHRDRFARMDGPILASHI